MLVQLEARFFPLNREVSIPDSVLIWVLLEALKGGEIRVRGDYVNKVKMRC